MALIPVPRYVLFLDYITLFRDVNVSFALSYVYRIRLAYMQIFKHYKRKVSVPLFVQSGSWCGSLIIFPFKYIYKYIFLVL